MTDAAEWRTRSARGASLALTVTLIATGAVAADDSLRSAPTAGQVVGPSELASASPSTHVGSAERSHGLVSEPRLLAVLYDNGPLVNSPGTGLGGADESVLQNLSLGLDSYGMSTHLTGTRVADDFTVPAGGWTIQTIKTYAYQTDSGPASTITSVNYRIWDGPPDDPGSSVVYGDGQSNRLVTTSWSNIYRVTEDTTGTNSQRPIMVNTLSCGTTLGAGTYWLDWQTDGSAASGPWAPPVTINGQVATGNGLRFLTGAQLWLTAIDTDPTTQQDFPFLLEDLGGSTLHDNGPLINSPLTGVGGANESVLQTNSLGMNLFGFAHAAGVAWRLADDFTAPVSWDIGQITLYAYQTDSGPVSTITSVNLQIWDGSPDAPGSTVVFGDEVTNRLASTSWTNIYRVSEETTGANDQRPIMANVVNVGTTLPAGTYWLDWQVTGSAASGPWAPPVTINGMTTTGNGLQYDFTNAVWQAALDGALSTGQGFPFLIEEGSCLVGSINPIVEVRAARAVADVALSWTPDPAATEYTTWWVDGDVGADGVPLARQNGAWPFVPGCLETAPTSCLHTDAISGLPNDIYLYQVRGGCAGQEAME